jgi:hypothetical protein
MPKVEMKISFDPETGSVSVSAPSDNMLAFGMIGFLQSYILNRVNWGQDKQNKIIPFGGPIPPLKSQ